MSLNLNPENDLNSHHSSHNFLPNSTFSNIQKTILHSHKPLQESKESSSMIDNLGFELPNQNELFSFTENRQFSLQVSNSLILLNSFTPLTLSLILRLTINHNTSFQSVIFHLTIQSLKPPGIISILIIYNTPMIPILNTNLLIYHLSLLQTLFFQLPMKCSSNGIKLIPINQLRASFNPC